ncbi:hypothetical protein [Pseudooctadecabacter jejudonensis]|uniref:Uncharacterized protein n=1 Tax=Pseudooctadecabacter jejudonensis TaxID=1391910 RepID=A0A1Y5TBY8_9RHOB|nr:hypothetical protein [Pseudooctadecabacter jejudonensis]SLN60487.1 hypothetical protein PSJ8397_03230 [Pseudooctadecabacter jejudonensis]
MVMQSPNVAGPQISGPTVQPSADAAPPPATPDARPTADTAALKTDPTPQVPLPMPATPNQSGLVSQAALPLQEDLPEFEPVGASQAERTLKPYGITMLPEDQEAQKPPPAEPVASDPDPTSDLDR